MYVPVCNYVMECASVCNLCNVSLYMEMRNCVMQVYGNVSDIFYNGMCQCVIM